MAATPAVRVLLQVLLAWLLQAATALPKISLDLIEEAGETPSPPAGLAKKHDDVKAKINHLTHAASKAMKVGNTVNLQTMRMELQSLRNELDAQRSNSAGDADPAWEEQVKTMEQQLDDLEDMLMALAAQEAKSKNRVVVISHAELQAEIDRLKEAVRRIQGTEKGVSSPDVSSGDGKELNYQIPQKELNYQIPSAPSPAAANIDGSDGASGSDGAGSGSGSGGDAGKGSDGKGGEGKDSDSKGSDDGGHAGAAGKGPAGGHGGSSGTIGTGGSSGAGGSDSAGAGGDGSEACTPDPCAGGKDIDMMMPYGDLEPFGREDTAQELTEASIAQSDAMVDQIERAEVAEEKRSIFRALTRLRGAAVTSFDGIARSNTGNIDEYSRKNQWRKAHPLQHLAHEESDISKWAFPDKSDF